MSDAWPFADPKNVATFTVRQIAVDGHPILRVYHDIEDGGWQFLERDKPSMKDAMLVSLNNVVARDPTVLELADLPLGWQAMRQTSTDPWQREPNPANIDRSDNQRDDP
jgi:hypothetical protein